MVRGFLRRSAAGKALGAAAVLAVLLPTAASADTVAATVRTPGASSGPAATFSEISTHGDCTTGPVSGGDTDPNTGLPDPGSGGPGGNGARGGNGGGGGGGGWYGGAGGSGGGNPGNLYGAGGGGGSSYAAPAAGGAVLLPGVNHGNGRAAVSFRYRASTTLTPDKAVPLFGHPVTLTAEVGSNGPGTPSGTVTFLEGPTELATVPLAAGRARFTTAALQPGAHTVTARYDGDPSFAPDGTATAGLTVGFSGPCLTGARTGPLTVAPGQSLCLAAGARQTGPVTVRPGGALAVSGAELTGPLTADGALALTVCGTGLTGRVAITGTTGPVLFGADRDPAAATGCGGNALTGPLTLDANTGGLRAVANTLAGPVRITDNAGGAGPAFEANAVSGPLHCEGNLPAPSTAGTTTTGPRTGQCRP
ncbi:Ig-like domain-containing protein [Streptomyces sp. NRRL B-24484]|uniref:Ig-like domain-containing protein n=1 Tax=Streptomyces sp. NRRL B-24484 TaxID=1463833 RepID=UPI0004BE521B|nr:Ig-like domain-containing protein [Streptomyces sp. NRRL B-24484]